MWEDVYLDGGYLRIRKNRLGSRYEHGCGTTCGRKPGYCPERKQIRRGFKKTKSRAGRRTIGLPSPLIPNTDYHCWKQLHGDAGVLDGRLNDARHTAGTVLLPLGVPDVVVDAIMGWEPAGSARMRARYMHVTGPMLKNLAQQVGNALWAPHRRRAKGPETGRTRPVRPQLRRKITKSSPLSACDPHRFDSGQHAKKALTSQTGQGLLRIAW
jgi:integrase